jgi:hypothetical protein
MTVPLAFAPALRCQSRIVRAAVFAAASLGLAVGAHVVGGGAAPPEPVALAAGAALALFALAMTGRERRIGFIAASVISTQLVLHVSFALAPLLAGRSQDQTALWAQILFCHHGPSPITAAQVAAARATAGLSHADLPAALTGAGPAPHPDLLDAITASWWVAAMLAAHLAAAAVMAWWLRCGEKHAWQAIRRAAATVGSQIVALVAPPLQPDVMRSSTMPVEDASRRRRPECRWTHDIQRRGPPVTS